MWILVFMLIFLNKTSIPNNNINQETAPDILTLTFAGDIMAHDVNFKMKDYNEIYADIKDILLNDDFSFANIEMPVCDSLPMSTYPNFNVHRSYLQAAAEGGFDVFSFANNHTNDQQVKGIDGSLSSIKYLQDEYKKTSPERKIYYSGLKETKTEMMKPVLIEYKNWKLLFLAVTEILNSYDVSKNRLYYSPLPYWAEKNFYKK